MHQHHTSSNLFLCKTEKPAALRFNAQLYDDIRKQSNAEVYFYGII